MRHLLYLLLPLLSSFITESKAQQATLIMLDSGQQTSIRGLSVVNDKVIWVSGSKGMFGRSTDGGKTFLWHTVPGYEEKEFRDIEAFSGEEAILMAIGSPAVLLKTKDGGLSWYKVFEDAGKEMFLDAMDIDARGNGCVVGDPVEGRIFLAFTQDFGEHWTVHRKLPALPGEAFFASSGTNILIERKKKQSSFLCVSGGVHSRLFHGANAYTSGITQGTASKGANSIARHGRMAVIVGGDYQHDMDTTGNCMLVRLGSAPVFTKPFSGPKGYRSCVLYYRKKIWVTCGTSGIDLSVDDGRRWRNIATAGFHVVQKAKQGRSVFVAGSRGRIARLLITP